ncbi:Lrp/AsnC family transcriptional regulator [Candidatus Bathyarchaeota archaeon]|nr:Lrp/AsnC family transcriptional regulator [Candidatus Bathyarchaeota archaeon]
MVSAYVLTKVEAGKDKEVLKQVKALEGVKKVSITYGEYDVIVEADFDKLQELDKFVFYTLRMIPQVKETMTIICVET